MPDPLASPPLGQPEARPTGFAAVVLHIGDSELTCHLAPGSRLDVNFDTQSYEISDNVPTAGSTSSRAPPQRASNEPNRRRKSRVDGYVKGLLMGQRMMMYQMYLHHVAREHVDWDMVAKAEKWLDQRRLEGNFYPSELDAHAIDVFPYNLWEPDSRSFDLSGCTTVPSWNADNANAAIEYYRHVGTEKERSPLYSYRLDWDAFRQAIDRIIGPGTPGGPGTDSATYKFNAETGSSAG